MTGLIRSHDPASGQYAIGKVICAGYEFNS